MNTGEPYEMLTQEIFQQILNQEIATNIKVEHDIILQGKDTTHQIDVYWEFVIGGINYKTIIQAKDWMNKVPKSAMLTFKGVIDDLPDVSNGIFVTKTGYQKGAVEVAKANNIQIYELRIPNEKDWEGKIKDIIMEINLVMPVYNNLQIGFDESWVKENNINFGGFSNRIAVNSDTSLLDSENNVVEKLSSVINKLCEKAGEMPKQMNHDFTSDVFIEHDGVKLKLRQLSGEFHMSNNKSKIEIKGDDVVGHILFDMMTNSSRKFDKHNRLI